MIHTKLIYKAALHSTEPSPRHKVCRALMSSSNKLGSFKNGQAGHGRLQSEHRGTRLLRCRRGQIKSSCEFKRARIQAAQIALESFLFKCVRAGLAISAMSPSHSPLSLSLPSLSLAPPPASHFSPSLASIWVTLGL